MNEILNKKVFFKDLNLIPYEQALAIQTEVFEKTISTKIKNRDLTLPDKNITDNYLFFCEHPHVFTLGKSGAIGNLLINEEKLAGIKAQFYKSNRGGDITYHGPGQLVVYPILDLDNFFTDIHLYMRTLEEAVIVSLKHFGIIGERVEGLTGVWVKSKLGDKYSKICALGVKTSRWVTMHGLALNVNTNLSYFSNIIPCGINDKDVTSIEKELGKSISLNSVGSQLLKNIGILFKMDILQNN